MENMDNNNSNWDENNKSMMINELTQGKDLVKQLGIHLDRASSPTGELLISKILSSIENVLSMLNSGSSSSGGATPELSHQLTGLTGGAATTGVESPRSVSGSPRSSDDSDPMMMMMMEDKSKKRKTLPRWTEQVRISSGTGLEGPLDDGYSWRKYGQKDILGAKHPRGYYRCTHRNVQGCLATKQVQRSDEDSSIFGITYRGRHTCIQASRQYSLQSPKKRNQGNGQKQENQVEQKSAHEILMNFRTGLEVKTEDLDTRVDFRCSSFSFPASTSTLGCLENENHIFSSLTPENNFMGGNFSPSFISPTTSESNYYSPYRMNSFGGGHNLKTPESDLNEIISAATSTTNSPILELDFSLDPVDFDSHFPFDSLEFFN